MNPQPRSIIEEYDALIAQGRIERDARQVAIIQKLDGLRGFLGDQKLAKKSSSLGWLFGAKKETAPPPRGLYVWGSVGRGKTMIMDLFFDAVAVEKKRRVHFHAFMADVHKKIFAWRQLKKANQVKGDDPIQPVADQLIHEATLLCFDEFAVTDIADAMILGRLFEALWARGVVVVATSNVDPVDLYRDGLNRALFLPFIALIQQKMEVVKLDARTDFRLEKLSGAPVYHVPNDEKAAQALDKAFLALTGVKQGKPARLPILGREIAIPQSSAHVARFDYADLCKKPLGAADFLAIAEAYHVVVLDNIPQIAPDERNEAKRFINLIDALYDLKVKLIASAAVEPDQIYLAAQGREAFEIARTISRLTEMRSEQYMELPHGHGDQPSGAATGLVET